MKEVINEKTSKEDIIMPQLTLCPECGEYSRFTIKNYNIKIYDCLNYHKTDNILLEEYKDISKKIKEKTICEICKEKVFINNFYKCNTCNKCICSTCLKCHNTTHSTVNYTKNFFICFKHNKPYNSYCSNCHKNICVLCELEHKDKQHYILNYTEIKSDINDLRNKMKKMRIKIDQLINDTKDIILILNKFIENIEIYYNIYDYSLKNYEKGNINFQILRDLYNIDKKNKEFINDINEIISQKNICDKFNKINNLYEKMNTKDEITLKYIINKNEEYVDIFGYKFVERNKNNCYIKYEGEKLPLCQKLKIKDEQKDKEIIEIKLIGFNNIKNMSRMFNYCNSLSPLSNFSKCDLSNVTNISFLFSNCSELKSLPDISNWKTHNIQRMHNVFEECSSLISLPDISKWDTSNVDIMSKMFYKCSSLTSLPDISLWNTSNVTDMNHMFDNCKNLTFIPDISKWDTSRVKDMIFMFNGCSSLLSLPDISTWNTRFVRNMTFMFYNCSSLSTIPDMSKWNTRFCNNYRFMFEKCSSLTSFPDFSKWFSNKKVLLIENMFGKCYSLSSIPPKGIYNSTKKFMFPNCINTINLK